MIKEFLKRFVGLSDEDNAILRDLGRRWHATADEYYSTIEDLDSYINDLEDLNDDLTRQVEELQQEFR